MTNSDLKNGVVFQGKSKKGTDIVIRYPTMSDAKELRRYINAISKEKTFVVYQGEQLSLKDEKDWLKKTIERIKNGQEVGLSPFIGKKVIGVCGIRMGSKIKKHIGSLAISIAKKYRGEGIGWLLMNAVIKESKKKLKGLKIIVLDVFEINSRARKLYKKMGFKECGFLPGGLLYKRKYTGEVSMYKKV